jgi:hypothetical protein
VGSFSFRGRPLNGPAPRRAVLLGASNLAAGLATAWGALRRRVGGPVEGLAACGRGRSYGTASRFLFLRTLPGILESGLWAELASRPPLPTVALLADVGNDLIYGQDPATVARWVERCAARLAPAELALCLLPEASLAALSERRYRFFHRLLFPLRPLRPRARLLDQARELNDRLRRLGQVRGLRLIAPPAVWFGPDPIHIRPRARCSAWEHLLGFESLPPAPKPHDPPPSPNRSLWPEISAATFRLGGVELHRRQPVLREPDGSTLALY